MTQYPAYTPASSLGKELGIMFAFIGACLVTMGVYSVIWRRIQLRTQEEDLARRKALKSRTAAQPDTLSVANGLHYGGGGRNTSMSANMSISAAAAPGGERIHEKMVDRYAVPGDRVELPVHGMGMRREGKGDLL